MNMFSWVSRVEVDLTICITDIPIKGEKVFDVVTCFETIEPDQR